MVSIVHAPSSHRKVTALLKAYFDESGFEGPLFTLCGYVAPRDVWETFDGQWQALLQKPCIYPVESIYADSICKPLEYLHAQEMEGLGSGRFRQLGHHKRYYLIKEIDAFIR